jgi:hypothetical protein
LRATEDYIKRLGSRYATSASILTIQESRKAIKQAEDIGYKLFLRGSLILFLVLRTNIN